MAQAVQGGAAQVAGAAFQGVEGGSGRTGVAIAHGVAGKVQAPWRFHQERLRDALQVLRRQACQRQDVHGRRHGIGRRG